MKATPDSAPASADSVMALVEKYGTDEFKCRPSIASFEEIRAEVERLAAQSVPLQQADCTCAAKDMPFGRCCRAAAQVEQYMPSSEWLAEAIDLVAHIGPMTDRLRAHLSKRVTAPQLKHAGWFQELPSGMSYRLWEQGGHEAQPGDVELFEVVIPANGEVRPTQAQGQDAAPAEQPVTEFNVGRYCLSEDDCIAQGINFAAYERGISDAAEAFSRNT